RLLAEEGRGGDAGGVQGGVPVLDQQAAAVPLRPPGGAVTDRHDVGAGGALPDGGAERGVGDDPALGEQARAVQPVQPGADADADHDLVGGDPVAVGQGQAAGLDRGDLDAG